MPKSQKQADAKDDDAITPQIYNFKKGKFWYSQNATIQPESTVDRVFIYTRGLFGNNLKYKIKDTSTNDAWKNMWHTLHTNAHFS